MKKYLWLTFAIIINVIISCKNQHEQKKTEQNEHQEKHISTWEYEGEMGPEHWADLKIHADCGERFQSPINIIKSDVIRDSTLKPLEIYYGKLTQIHEVINNGHTIQYNFEKGDYIMLNEDKYELKQIHFHEASEHTINGIRYPMEMHMVHVNKDKKVAVLGVMVEEGTNSEPFDFLESYLPLALNETKKVDKAFNVNLNIPKNKAYYHYTGSFTTPPCTEGVKWFIFKESIRVSVTQVKVLQKLMPMNNFRNEQPLNGRTVTTM